MAKTPLFSKLRTAFQKARLGMALCSGILLTNVSSDTSVDTPTKHKIHFNTPETSTTQKINDSIFAGAKEREMIFIDIVKNDHSKTLDSLETIFNAQLKNHNDNAEFKTVYIFDPNVFDLMTALKFSNDAAVINTLMKKHLPRLDFFAVKDIHAGMHAPYVTKTNDTIQSLAPMLLKNGTLYETQAGFIIPSPIYNMPPLVKGLTAKQSAILFTQHEFFHAKDTVFTIEKIKITDTEIENLHKTDLRDLQSLPQNTGGLKLLLNVMHRESFADVGAVGETIRQGQSPLSLINNMIAWRDMAGGLNEKHLTLSHFTQPALNGLKTEIQKMGLKNFQSMTASDAEKLYAQIIQNYAMDHENLSHVITAYYNDTPDNLSDKEKNYFDIFKKPVPKGQFITSKRQQHKINRAMTNYKETVLQNLTDKAFDIGGKVIPETMIKSYVTLQNDLIRAPKKTNLDHVIYDAKMNVLKQTFITSLSTLNYADVNKQYGVDVADILPQPLGKDRPKYSIKLVF